MKKFDVFEGSLGRQILKLETEFIRPFFSTATASNFVAGLQSRFSSSVENKMGKEGVMCVFMRLRDPVLAALTGNMSLMDLSAPLCPDKADTHQDQDQDLTAATHTHTRHTQRKKKIQVFIIRREKRGN